MEKSWDIPNLYVLQNENRIMDDFVTDYDSFIEESSTEDMEQFIRSLALSFYKKGYAKASERFRQNSCVNERPATGTN